MDLATLQARLAEKYGPGDRELGHAYLAMVLVEEVGELAEAARKGDAEAVGAEAVDVCFMALSLASLCGVDVEARLRGKFLDRPLDDVAAGWEDAARPPGGGD